ncbi:MAG: hypothetical protein IH851_07410 [Armatimonadetes bacterium]|nr:hypothetical protein [Armatimonadota bacterium]
MGLSRSTVGITRFLESLVGGRPERPAGLIFLISAAGILLITTGMLIAFEADVKTVIAAAGILGGLALFAVMLVRHEWLFLFGIIAGHTIFYGRFPSSLGMRVKDSIGPGDFLFFLAFVAALIYWAGRKDRPRTPWPLIWPPAILFTYTLAYTLIAFFLWERQDHALSQAVGWFYFILAWPAYLCLSGGRIWRPFFVIILLALVAGAFLSACAEQGVLLDVLNRTGYGGIGTRSFGDTAVKTNFLGMTIVGTLIATVIVGFARRPGWFLGAVIAALSGCVILLLDRGRIHWAGMLLATVLLMAVLPNASRRKVVVTATTSVLIVVLLIQAAGGEVRDRFNVALEKGWRRIELSKPDALAVDQGLTLRMYRKRLAQAEFYENPLFGGGPGVILGYTTDWQTLKRVPISYLDDSFIYPLSVGGIAGYSMIWFCYITFVGAGIYAFRRLRNRLHRALAAVPLGMFVFLTICIPVMWWLVDRFHIAAFALMTAMSLALVHHERVHGSDVPVVDF